MIAGKLILSNILYKARIHSNHDVQQISHHPWFSIRITLFDMPTDHVGMPYAKGGDYLTITFLESCWTREKIENGLEGLAKLRGTHAALILISYQVIHIANSLMIFYSSSDQPGQTHLEGLHVLGGQ